jgi:hypothetical protein
MATVRQVREVLKVGVSSIPPFLNLQQMVTWGLTSAEVAWDQYAIVADRDLHRFRGTQRACLELFEGGLVHRKRGPSLPFGCSKGKLFGRSE